MKVEAQIENEHSILFYQVCKLKIRGLLPREVALRVIWQRISEDEVVLCYSTLSSEERPLNRQYIRAKTFAVHRFERIGDEAGIPRTMHTYIAQWIDSASLCGQECVDPAVVGEHISEEV